MKKNKIIIAIIFVFILLIGLNNIIYASDDIDVVCSNDTCDELVWQTTAGASTRTKKLDLKIAEKYFFVDDIMTYLNTDISSTVKFKVINNNLKYNEANDNSLNSIVLVNQFKGNEYEKKQQAFRYIINALPSINNYSNPSIKIKNEINTPFIFNFDSPEYSYEIQYEESNPTEKTKATSVVTNIMDKTETNQIKQAMKDKRITDNYAYVSKSFAFRNLYGYNHDTGEVEPQGWHKRTGEIVYNIDNEFDFYVWCARFWGNIPNPVDSNGNLTSEAINFVDGSARGFKDLLNRKFLFPTQLSEKEVYVKHIVHENASDVVGTQISGNDAEVLIDSKNQKSIINNQGPKDGYNEYYKINSDSRLQVSKSLTLVENESNKGVLYRFDNAKIVSGTTLNEAQNMLQYTTSTNKTTLLTSADDSSNKVVTVIEFHYYKENVPEPVGTSDIDSGIIKTDDNSAQGCKIVYTPSGEVLMPYLKTTKFVPNQIKYKLTLVDGNPVYELKEFKAYYLNYGTLYNVNGSSKDMLFTENNGTNNINIQADSQTLKNEMAEYAKLFDKKSLENIPVNLSPSGNTTINSFINNKYTVPYDKYNGIRDYTSTATYTLYDYINASNLNATKQITMTENPMVNVYTPLNLSYKTEYDKTNIVNHTDHEVNDSTLQIQKNSEFTIKLSANPTSDYVDKNGSNLPTLKYVKYYIVMLDFDVKLVNNYGESNELKAGSVVKANTPIIVNPSQDKTATFTAIATSDDTNSDSVDISENKIKVLGVTYNMPSGLKNPVFEELKAGRETYIDKNSIKKVISLCEDENRSHNNGNYFENGILMLDDAHYFAIANITTVNLGRIYDFKITDCSDVDFKNVFRKSSTGNAVNDLTGIEYYSGTKKLNIYSSITNQLGNRTNINIPNTASSTILPLGPYKHYSGTYLRAPKLGYRFSFDLKTSGYYDANNTSISRTIHIKPSYYYVSKDGSTIETNIDLYFKNSTGRYVRLSDTDYSIYFTPNDGYRSYLNNGVASDTSTFSNKKQEIKIGNSDEFILTKDMMVKADDNFIQVWYGEFKLPNSTIVVKKGDNLNKALTNGYIAVKFDITCVDEKDGTIISTLSYNKDNSNLTENSENTTEWDYEGYLGVEAGKSIDEIRLQLENGILKIDNDTYKNVVKGTVALFDLDNRAADDFN